jgi:hypothetical protein
MNLPLNGADPFTRETGAGVHGEYAARCCAAGRPVAALSRSTKLMSNQPQNPSQNPGQKAPGQDDKPRRDTNPSNPNDPNRPKNPGTDDPNKKQMQDK